MKLQLEEPMKKIGLFGGSFNPIHLGHLILAQEALYQYQLDKVIFIPAANPPHKDPQELIEPYHRYRMTELAIAGNPKFEISDMELKRDGKSYTIETVNTYQKLYPEETELYLIVGMDSLAEIFTWKDAENLIDLICFLGAPRQGYEWKMLDERVKKRIKLIQMPIIEIASRIIRERIRMKEPVRYWVPEPVFDYLMEQELYKGQVNSEIATLRSQ